MRKLNIFSGSRVLITGHTGFKGSWLTLWLSRLGAEVHGVSQSVPTYPSHFVAARLDSQITDHCLNILDDSALKDLVREVQPDFVFHLAAQALVRRSYEAPLETWQVNTIGTVNVLESLRGLRKPCVAVFITSDKCYDNLEWVWGYRETDALGGPDPYSASKGSAELAIRSDVRSFLPSDGMVRIGIGRAGNVIGGGDWAADRIVPDCMRSWSQGELVELRRPSATRPWQHVLEPLSGYLSLAMALHVTANLHGEPFNFGPSAEQNHSVKELVSAMAPHWNQVCWRDVSAEYGGPYESGLLKLNCDKALHELGWRATWDFSTTVRETVLWYRRFYDNLTQPIGDYSYGQIVTYTKTAESLGVQWAI